MIHPSLPDKHDSDRAKLRWTPPTIRGKFKVLAPVLTKFGKLQKIYRRSIEEGFLMAWKEFHGLQLKVSFHLLMPTPHGGKKYRMIPGSTLIFKKIPTPGRVLGIIRRIVNQALDEVGRSGDNVAKERVEEAYKEIK